MVPTVLILICARLLYVDPEGFITSYPNSPTLEFSASIVPNATSPSLDRVQPTHNSASIKRSKPPHIISSEEAGSHLIDTTTQGTPPQIPCAERQPSPFNQRKYARTHVCAICQYGTSNLKELGAHMRDIHNMRGFKCSHCDIRVGRHDNLRSHGKSCKGLQAVAAKRAVTPKASKRQRQRVNYLDLQGVSMYQTSIRDASPSAKERFLPVTRNIDPGDLQCKSTEDIRPLPGGEPDILKVGDDPSKTIAFLAEKVKVLEEQLEQKEEGLEERKVQCEVWTRQYLQLNKEYNILKTKLARNESEIQTLTKELLNLRNLNPYGTAAES
ncbi:hypothetical protein ABW20_dc0106215 [Dactylellina cionopaga]|nr:hypothetical protein ABW20_dc0106215 [Dactylellina cionopaga]